MSPIGEKIETHLRAEAEHKQNCLLQSPEFLEREDFISRTVGMVGSIAHLALEKKRLQVWSDLGLSRPFMMWHFWRRYRNQLSAECLTLVNKWEEMLPPQLTVKELLVLEGEEFIHFCYARLLLRAPDEAGFRNWLIWYQQGIPKEILLWRFAQYSPAGYQAPKDWAIITEWIAQKMSWETLLMVPFDLFLPLSYLRVLGRPLDKEGEQSWIPKFNNGFDRKVFLAILLHSREGKIRKQFLWESGLVTQEQWRHLRWLPGRMACLVRGMLPWELWKKAWGHYRLILRNKNSQKWAELKTLLQQGLEQQAGYGEYYRQQLEGIELKLQRERSQRQEWEQDQKERLSANTQSQHLLHEQVEKLALEIKQLQEENVLTRSKYCEENATFQQKWEQIQALESQELTQLAQHYTTGTDKIFVRVSETRDLLAQRQTIPVEPNVLLIKQGDFFVGAPAENWGIIASLVNGELWEPGVQQVIRSFLRPGMTAVDVGAHIGLHTLVMAQAVEAPGKVWAFEPALRAFDILKRNISLNGYRDRVKLYQIAVGDKDGIASFGVCTEELTWSSLYPTAGVTEIVPVEIQQLDSVLPQETRVDLVKIDTEGAELLVLQGMQNTIKRNLEIHIIMKISITNLSRGGVKLKDLTTLINQLGLKIQIIDDKNGSLLPYSERNLYSQVSCNILLGTKEYHEKTSSD